MLTALLSAISGTAALQAAFFLSECLLGASSKPGRSRTVADPAQLRATKDCRSVVVVPAHNEEAGIANTLRSIKSDLREGDKILVVADNCDDQTATIALREGANVVERSSLEERGKGYAIHYAIKHLSTHPPNTVIILDADCSIARGTIEALSTEALLSGAPVQADYVLSPPKDSALSLNQAISAFAIRVRNRVRPRGGARFGVPCPLTGSGMAFPWSVLANAPSMAGNIVEDLALGVELALMGHPPKYCSRARVSSDLPWGPEAAKSQRDRWETGHLATISKTAPRLLKAGITQRRWFLFAMGLDLSIPPLSFLIMSQGLIFGGGLICFLVEGSLVPAAIAFFSISLVGVGVISAWQSVGTDLLTARQLLLAPVYAVKKLPRYLGFLAKGPVKTWVRAQRQDEEHAE